MITTPTGRGLGWKRQRIDHRDLLFAADPRVVQALPPSVDLRGPGMPPIYDQGQIGSCTGNAWAAAFDFARMKQGLPPITPSRLMIYFDERILENTTDQDAGAEIRDGATALAKQGVCPEAEWPYNVARVLDAPPANDYTDALANLALQYQAVQQTPQQIMGALAQGFPIVIGFSVFQGFERIPASGIVPLPGMNEAPLGGHANLLVGYDATLARSHEVLLLTRNSWGMNWGQAGYGWFPMSYLTNAQLAADFWMLQLVSGSAPTPTPAPPTPIPGPYDVGARVLLAMQAERDTPGTNEDYPRRVDGSGAGYSVTQGKSGKTYVYTASTDRVAVFDPDRVV